MSRTLNPRPSSFFVERSDEETQAGILSRIGAIASMKKSTVEPVPTPRISPSFTYAVAASATARFNSFCVSAIALSLQGKRLILAYRMSTPPNEPHTYGYASLG